MSGGSASNARLDAGTPPAPPLTARFVLLVFGVVAMLTGFYGGLWRLGWDMPHADRLAELHGALMICGLFGTVIGLERAVAFGGTLAYAAPALAAVGTVLLLAGAPATAGAFAYALAGLVLTAVTVVIALRQRALFTVTLAAGAACWTVGTLLWGAGWTVPEIVGWWLAFLVLTIAGERLELSRLLAPRRGSGISFALIVVVFLAGAGLGPFDDWGAALLGVALMALTAWLARHDVVRITLRRPGQTGFMAVCMAAGYVWLGLAGVLFLAASPTRAAFDYDAILHAILIGFVLSMVFGHALIILPAVARLRLVYRPALYAPLALLHVSVVLRVAGDLLEDTDLRGWSGPLTLVALLGFVALLTYGARRLGTPRDGTQ
jgi:hypothetical protein